MKGDKTSKTKLNEHKIKCTSTIEKWNIFHPRTLKGNEEAYIGVVWNFQLLLILIEDIVRSISEKKCFTIKINSVSCIWVCDEFFCCQNGKKWSFWHHTPNLRESCFFHPYFVCKFSFRIISMMKMIILDKNKPIWLILKIQKFKNPEIVNYTFIIHKNGNKTSIQHILKLNSTSFVLNNFVLNREEGGRKGGSVLISSWKCNYSIYLDIQVYYLDIQAIFTQYLVWILNY